MDRKAKIVATLGPASREEVVIERLLQAGMNVARLNFSHGTHEEHAALVSRLRAVSKRLDVPLAILQDPQGPKIRVGVLKSPLTLTAGQTAVLYREGEEPPRKDGACWIPVDFPELFNSVSTGNRVLLDDGRLALKVITLRAVILSSCPV
jgi:pyruvate kinase